MSVKTKNRLENGACADNCGSKRTNRFFSVSSAKLDASSEIARLRDGVLQFVEDVGVTPGDIVDIQIAIGEALSNAFEHGCVCKERNNVSVLCEIVDGTFTVTITDEGEPFDEECITLPDFDGLPECGLGVFLMRQFMDRVEYTSNDIGKSVKMMKRLAHAL